MNMLKPFSLSAALLLASVAHAEHIPLEPQQIDALGIRWSPAQPAGDTREPALPTRVTIPPAQIQVVSAPQTGLVEQLSAAVGDHVSAGQVIAYLQSPQLLTQQREYLQTLTQLRLARSDLQRDETLFKEGVIAERRLLEKRSAHSELLALRDQQRQSLALAGMNKQALAKLESSRELSSQLCVCAPIDGVIMERYATAGERVEHIAPLYRIANLDTLWVEIRTPLSLLDGVSEGATVVTDDGNVSGRVILVGHEVDPANQTVLLRAEVTTGIDRLRPGQFLEMRLSASVADGVSVPAEAVVRDGQGSFVFLRTADGFDVEKISILNQSGGRALVSGNIKAGDPVAVSGMSSLKAAWQGIGGGE